jgi:hypothetical protein
LIAISVSSLLSRALVEQTASLLRTGLLDHVVEFAGLNDEEEAILF